MKIALFMDSDVFAGTERHIVALGTALRDESVDVSVACPTPSPLAEHAVEKQLPVISIQKCGLIDRGAIRRLRTALRTGELDLVHAHNGRTALSAAIAVRTAGVGRCVMTQHFLNPNHTNKTGPSAFVSGLAHRWMNRRFDHVIAISTAVRDASIARGDVREDRISKIPNGLPDIDTQAMPTKEQVRKELNLHSDNILVICVARLQPEKDVPSLVTAMFEIVRRNPATNIRCIVAGTGPELDKINRQIQQQGLTNIVTMLGHRTDVLSLIRASDMLVLPSTAEPFGLVLLEAMALAIPVIATSTGGPLEIVEDSVTGLLVPPSNSAALSRSIEQLAANETLRLSMGQAGRQRFVQKYSAREMAVETAKIYRKLIDREAVNDARASAADQTDDRKLAVARG